MVESKRKEYRAAIFLRMSAAELRRLVDRAPEIASELRHVAEQLEAEAIELSREKPA